MNERIQELCKENGITIAELERTLGFSNSSLRKDGGIKSDRLSKIADYFKVTTDYLCGRTDDKQGNPYKNVDYLMNLDETDVTIEPYQESERRLVHAPGTRRRTILLLREFNMLTEEQQEAVLKIVSSMKKPSEEEIMKQRMQQMEISKPGNMGRRL